MVKTGKFLIKNIIGYGMAIIMRVKYFIYRIIKKIYFLMKSEIGEENIKNININLSNSKHSMNNDLNEKYYLNQYLFHLDPFLKSLPENFRCLDLGCGDGRFLNYLLNNYKNSYINGCDISKLYINSLQKKTFKYKRDRVLLENISIEQKLNRTNDNFDLIFFTEVAFYMPNWEKSLKSAIKLLNRKGLIVFSTRSQYYQSVSMIKNGNLENLPLVINNRVGQIYPKITVPFTWNTSEELNEIFKKNKLNILLTTGIGSLSGLNNDIINYNEPKNLTSEGQRILNQSEIEIGNHLPDAGRYILIIARKEV
jgi:SAM-dependent methyltransferase